MVEGLKELLVFVIELQAQIYEKLLIDLRFDLAVRIE
jgi:hypothetical protein